MPVMKRKFNMKNHDSGVLENCTITADTRKALLHAVSIFMTGYAGSTIASYRMDENSFVGFGIHTETNQSTKLPFPLETAEEVVDMLVKWLTTTAVYPEGDGYADHEEPGFTITNEFHGPDSGQFTYNGSFTHASFKVTPTWIEYSK